MSEFVKKPVCMIPARGGSQRFPRKNIALLGGKPLIAWTIEAALHARIFDSIWVSSEDEEICNISKKYGASIAERPSELSGNSVTVVQVCKHFLRTLLKSFPDCPALYVLLPTSPLRQAETIRRAWEAFVESRADSLLSTLPSDHPPQWALKAVDGRLSALMPEEYEKPRDKIVPSFIHDGGHAIVKPKTFIHSPEFLGTNTIAFPVPREESVDINHELDLEWAEFLIKKKRV